MKKTNFLIAAMMLGLSVSGITKVVFAETIDGENSADVIINGTIGKLDNTDPDATIPEGSDEWINVTVDTATAFHTTTASAHKNIESADYSIVNNSGRGVAVTLNKMIGAPKYVDKLTINAKGTGLVATPTATNLVENNTLVDLASAPVWMKLANKDGRLNIDTDTAAAYANAAKFNYTGNTVASLPSDVNEKAAKEDYTLTLKFTSIQKDGTTIGVTP
ncbi:hypothetical protein ACWOC1_10885 [Enterococcus quebecensis]|uniref:WxL domain-containing protein n=1 Tax=Enterococcus quebecensis TaxID=903983 RepID=A0A1E5H020_9ENTE|nr:hypothetical protein [Enterococcus quebecensis]OEG18324.1 hypothetical protein BCR23_13920 [Enterococcus quebecensis]OJG72518.1 hypothetical protein RV12_GL000932 [Enterococcus quebecensis]